MLNLKKAIGTSIKEHLVPLTDGNSTNISSSFSTSLLNPAEKIPQPWSSNKCKDIKLLWYSTVLYIPIKDLSNDPISLPAYTWDRWPNLLLSWHKVLYPGRLYDQCYETNINLRHICKYKFYSEQILRKRQNFKCITIIVSCNFLQETM